FARMICVAAYFLVGYTLVGLLVAGIAFLPESEPNSTVRILRGTYPRKSLIASALCLLPLVPYSVVSAETFLFAPILAPNLESDLQHSGETDIVRAVRVLWPIWGGAHVYFVQDCESMGSKGQSGWTVDLVSRDGRWQMAGDPDIVWPDCGSAHGNIFPPYLEG